MSLTIVNCPYKLQFTSNKPGLLTRDRELGSVHFCEFGIWRAIAVHDRIVPSIPIIRIFIGFYFILNSSSKVVETLNIRFKLFIYKSLLVQNISYCLNQKNLKQVSVTYNTLYI